jgi:prepilin-type N-terminal cleavage/methylation domain-containing protein
MRLIPARREPQAGFSLVEMLIAISVMGLLLAMAIPRVRDTMNSREVKSARAALATTYARARIYALQQRRPAKVHFSGSSVWVTTPNSAGIDSTVGAILNLGSIHGVNLNATEPTVTFLPTGLLQQALGEALVVRVGRAGKRDSVVISGYGRLR